MYSRYLKITRSTLGRDRVFFYFPKNLPIAFDWDETLIDTRIQFEHGVRRSIELYGDFDRFGEFEEDLAGVIPDWVYEFFTKLNRKIHIISNKPTNILMSELSREPFADKIESITGDAGKPNNAQAFHNIGPNGILFGDSIRNDLVGALRAGWLYQFLTVHHIRNDSEVTIVDI